TSTLRSPARSRKFWPSARRKASRVATRTSIPAMSNACSRRGSAGSWRRPNARSTPSNSGGRPLAAHSGGVSHADLLALYDHDERFASTFPQARRDELPHLVRHIDLVEHSGVVLFSRLDASNVEATIQEQLGYFE